MVDRKDPTLDAKHQAILRKMMQVPENKICADCKSPSARWASTNLGVFLCISCSGIHRKLGTHISQVRSTTLDTWTPGQIAHFTKLGNAKAALYFEACLAPEFRRPLSSQSMNMERFIRDKYEKKRYITVENGGLGGQSSGPSSLRSSYTPYQGSNTLGPRPSQSLPASSHGSALYDNVDINRAAPKSSMSYSSRFGSASRSTPVQLPYRTRGTGQFHASSAEYSKNPMQRASTLNELLNMGFSIKLASRAVEISKGDLQSAIEWVLQQKDTQTPVTAPTPTPPQSKIIPDLLDFGAPTTDATPSPTRTGPAPRAASSEVLVAQKSPVASKPAHADGFGDFADFGAFESALPVSKPAPPSLSQPLKSPNTAALSSYYNQSPPGQPLRSGSGTQFSRLDQRAMQLSPKARTKPSPKLMAKKASEVRVKVPEEDLGLTTFNSLAKSAKQLSKSVEATARSPRLHYKAPSHGIRQDAPAPPSPVHVTVASGVKGDSPPTAPPPGIGQTVNELSINASKPNGESSSTGETDTSAKSNPAGDSHTPELPQTESKEDEDPFAALYMMALTSAKAAPKKQPLPRPATSQGMGKMPPSTGVGANGAKKDINLDDLFG